MDREFTFLTISRLTEGKGISDLLQAIQEFTRSGGRARFRIVGPGPLAYYEGVAESLGISDAVSILGPMNRDETAAEMRSTHALIMPARHESFGVVAIEAMASGIPVLATRCGGPDDVVTADAGILVEPRNPAALADGMADMIHRRPIFDRDTIVSYCRGRYGAVAVVAQIETLYCEILAQSEDRARAG